MKTRILAMNPAKMATDIMSTSTTELTFFHSITFVWLARFALASLKKCTSLRSVQEDRLEGLHRVLYGYKLDSLSVDGGGAAGGANEAFVGKCGHAAAGQQASVEGGETYGHRGRGQENLRPGERAERGGVDEDEQNI